MTDVCVFFFATHKSSHSNANSKSSFTHSNENQYNKLMNLMILKFKQDDAITIITTTKAY